MPDISLRPRAVGMFRGSTFSVVRGAGIVGVALILGMTVGCETAVGSSQSTYPSSTSYSSQRLYSSPSPSTSSATSGVAGVIPALKFRVLQDFGLTSYKDALEHARELVVKGRVPKTGYRRALYGRSWDDNTSVPLGHNGCRTREDILQRDLVNVTVRPGTGGCVVESGTLLDPYTGDVVYFQRGQGTSALVQIDHVVALADSWVKGAQAWSMDKRRAFANDPRNLLAVSGWVNSQKGTGDTATWLPPNKVYRCEYVARQVEVKRLYSLWVTLAEQRAMMSVLQKCVIPSVAS